MKDASCVDQVHHFGHLLLTLVEACFFLETLTSTQARILGSDEFTTNSEDQRASRYDLKQQRGQSCVLQNLVPFTLLDLAESNQMRSHVRTPALQDFCQRESAVEVQPHVVQLLNHCCKCKVTSLGLNCALRRCGAYRPRSWSSRRWWIACLPRPSCSFRQRRGRCECPGSP